jgi:hypothetical protein
MLLAYAPSRLAVSLMLWGKPISGAEPGVGCGFPGDNKHERVMSALLYERLSIRI